MGGVLAWLFVDHQDGIPVLLPCLVARPASGQFDNPAGFLFPDGKAIALRFLVELLYNMFDFQRFESNYGIKVGTKVLLIRCDELATETP